MIIKVHSIGVDGGKNTGSSSNLIQYLDKENRNVDILDQEGFFNHESENITPDIAERVIDGNKGRLSKDETKFYMLTVNPSERELKHISTNETALKSYVRDLMDVYAKNFNREYPDGEPLKGSDLVYFAKIEHERTYKYDDKRFRETIIKNNRIRSEIIKNMDNPEKVKALEKTYIRDKNNTPILEGNPKAGNNVHVHIVVSRYDKQQKFKLSPMANQKSGKGKLNGQEHSKGFNRDEFVASGERLFDRKFNYKRAFDESYKYYKSANLAVTAVTNPKSLVKIMVKRALMESIKDKTLQTNLNMATTNPKHIPKQAIRRIEKEAIKAVMNSLDKTSYTNPVSFGINVARKTITIAARAISKSVGI
ncbi:hypothetical protein MTsPCn9_34180 [Croceitalea sp. MTPC9]|uniref:MobB family relaxase n=1 Tax=unclassified Croceitalea TaxID=2632280 RepID=UPI002B3B02B7|nr:hypothetical protein MTsPCn6_34770 [Croceitalea sp. MTPC6]GMN18478.1 hypothetical protein MTsPCn9_34180 [Croceitalea sp. MTPC9]